MAASARELFAAYIPNGDMASYASELATKLRKDFTGTMSLFREPDFQDLLVNYPRAPRTFVIAYEAQDEVSSAWLVRGLDGKEYKPADYLAAFARFVKENPSKIEAIEILLDRPQQWSTEALGELRLKLSATQERFTVDNLQRAHQVQYHKALIDIISMVKHAAREQEPLYTAEERVRQAFDKLTEGKSFNGEQLKWLERIREHLIANLSIDKDDFEVVPIFTHFGGWGRANRAFNNGLDDIIRDLNEAIAA